MLTVTCRARQDFFSAHAEIYVWKSASFYAGCDASSTWTTNCYFTQKVGKKVWICNKEAPGSATRNLDMYNIAEGRMRFDFSVDLQKKVYFFFLLQKNSR